MEEKITRRTAIAALAGAFVPPRDPLTDPLPGDVVIQCAEEVCDA